MQKYRVAIYDGDGTIFWGKRRSIAVFCRLLAARGVKITPGFWYEAALQWGTKLDGLREMFFPHITEKMLVDEIYPAMERLVKVVPYPGVRNALALIQGRGVDQYMNTSRARVGMLRYLGQHELRGLFTRVICFEDVGSANAKPSTYGIELILKRLNEIACVTRDEVVYIGDCPGADLPCAVNAGIKFLAVHEENVITRQVWRDRGLRDEDILPSIRDLPVRLGLA